MKTIKTIKIGDFEITPGIPNGISLMVGWTAVWSWNEYTNRKKVQPIVINNKLVAPQIKNVNEFLSKPGAEMVFCVRTHLIHEIKRGVNKSLPVSSYLTAVNIDGKARMAQTDDAVLNLCRLGAGKSIDVSDQFEASDLFGDMKTALSKFRSQIRSLTLKGN